jgi:rhodanese-related sulfurtransferase
MKLKRSVLVGALSLSMLLSACGNQNTNDNNGSNAESNDTAVTESVESTETTEEANKTNEMQYISVEDTKEKVEANDEEYVFLDVRKAEDYQAGHVKNFINADLDKAKDGDIEDGKTNIKEALAGEPTNDKKYVLLCYSGKSYAQAGTDILINEFKIDPSNVYTIEGGMKAWEAAGDDYTALIEK